MLLLKAVLSPSLPSTSNHTTRTHQQTVNMLENDTTDARKSCEAAQDESRHTSPESEESWPLRGNFTVYDSDKENNSNKNPKEEPDYVHIRELMMQSVKVLRDQGGNAEHIVSYLVSVTEVLTAPRNLPRSSLPNNQRKYSTCDRSH